jgi:hypothetical protein
MYINLIGIVVHTFACMGASEAQMSAIVKMAGKHQRFLWQALLSNSDGIMSNSKPLSPTPIGKLK